MDIKDLTSMEQYAICGGLTMKQVLEMREIRKAQEHEKATAPGIKVENIHMEQAQSEIEEKMDVVIGVGNNFKSALQQEKMEQAARQGRGIVLETSVDTFPIPTPSLQRLGRMLAMAAAAAAATVPSFGGYGSDYGSGNGFRRTYWGVDSWGRIAPQMAGRFKFTDDGAPWREKKVKKLAGRQQQTSRKAMAANAERYKHIQARNAVRKLHNEKFKK